MNNRQIAVYTIFNHIFSSYVDKVFGQHVGGIFIKLKISQFEVAFPFYVVFLFIIIYFINYLLTADDQHYR